MWGMLVIVCLLFFFHQQPTHALCREAAGAGVGESGSQYHDFKFLCEFSTVWFPWKFGEGERVRLSCLIVKSAGDISPTLEIDVLEYKDEYVLPTGYGATIICRSNCLKLRCSMYENPSQITLLFNGTLAKSCSGSNPQKTCSYFIHNTAEGNSGDYTCKTYNQYGCTMDTLRLVFKGKLTAALSYLKNVTAWNSLAVKGHH